MLLVVCWAFVVASLRGTARFCATLHLRRRVGFTSGFQHSALGSVTLWCFNIVSRRRKGEYRMNNVGSNAVQVHGYLLTSEKPLVVLDLVLVGI